MKKKIIIIPLLLAILILGAVAILTSMKLKKIGTEPVAPTARVPSRAASEDVCTVSLTIPGQSCSNGCNATEDCAEGLECVGDKCVNPECTQETDCVCALASPSPSPAPSPSPSPSPSPLGTCQRSCTVNQNCVAGLVCAAGMCANPGCLNDADCVCSTPVSGGTTVVSQPTPTPIVVTVTPTPAPVFQPTPLPTPTPTTVAEVKLPKAGSVGATLGVMSVGVAAIILGMLATLLF